MDVLIIGGWVVTRRPYPLLHAASDSTLTDSLKDSIVRAEPYYLAETTSSPQGGVPRLRVDVGSGSTEESTPEWLDLPSQLHYDLLQVLQPQIGPDNNANDDDISVRELFEALSWTDVDEGEDEGEGVELAPSLSSVDWKSFRDSLQWLHDRCLVSFETETETETEALEEAGGGGSGLFGEILQAISSSEITDADYDNDIAKMFTGTKVVDLRGIDDLL